MKIVKNKKKVTKSKKILYLLLFLPFILIVLFWGAIFTVYSGSLFIGFGLGLGAFANILYGYYGWIYYVVVMIVFIVMQYNEDKKSE